MKKDIIEVIKQQNQNVETKNSEVTKGALDSYLKTQLGLGVAGMAPVIGAGADITALFHSLKHGETSDALWNFASAVPGLGLFAGGKKIGKGVTDIQYLMKNAGMSEKEAIEFVQKTSKSKASKEGSTRVVDASESQIQEHKNLYEKDPRDQINKAENVVKEDMRFLDSLKEDKQFTTDKLRDIIKKYFGKN